MIIQGKDYSAQIKELDNFIDALPTKEGKLIAVLHKAQELLGFLPVEVQNHIALRLDVPAAKVYGVVTFYSFFNMDRKGQFNVQVCLGTACFVRGAEGLVEEFKKELGIGDGETDANGLFSLDCIRCVGACGLAPVLSVNGKIYGRVTPEDVKGIVEEQMSMIKDGAAE